MQISKFCIKKSNVGSLSIPVAPIVPEIVGLLGLQKLNLAV